MDDEQEESFIQEVGNGAVDYFQRASEGDFDVAVRASLYTLATILAVAKEQTGTDNTEAVIRLLRIMVCAEAPTSTRLQ